LPDGRVMNPEAVKEKYGVSVQQWVDYRSLVGDSSDNLPGAKGIGEKTAAKLLQEWHSLESLYDHLEQLSSKLRQSLQESQDKVKLSHALSQIHTDVPIELDFQQCHRREPDRAGLKQMLEELEFGSILREMHLLAAPASAEEVAWPPPADAFLGYTLNRAQPMWADWTGLGAAKDGKVYRGLPDLQELQKFPEIRAMSAKDLSVLALREGVWVTPGDDPLLLAYLYDPSNNEAATTARRYGAGDWTDDPVERAQVAQTLWQTLLDRTSDNPHTDWLYREIEKPLSAVLAKVEARGISLDADYVAELSEELSKDISYLEAEIHRLAGRPFNVNSRDQLEVVLYDELGLTTSGKKTQTGKRSTAASALEELLEQHQIIEKILNYRELSKLKSTYLEPLPKLIHPKTGRLHTRLNQAGTATGRLSSSDPNLQNIPVRTEIGRKIRKAFVAAPGLKLIAADYSQIELRILAHMSGDENLIRIFKEGHDIHTQTAAWMFGLKPEEVDSFRRRAAKTIVFGVLYGMSAHRLSSELSIPYVEAENFIERYFASYPRVRAWIDKTLEDAREKGYVETLFGRRRFVPDLNSKIRTVREAAERMAFNMPVQGTATGDLMKLAMVKLHPELERRKAHLVLQVHDELLVEVAEDQADEVAEVVREVMQNAWKFNVPIEVGIGIGQNWLEAK